MDKIQKALAKLYFALGEQKKQIPANVENPTFYIEYLAALQIRNTGAAFGNKYFAMGAASADRCSKKPPRGKTHSAGKPAKLSPPRGKNTKKPVKKRDINEELDEINFSDEEMGWD